VDGIQTPGDAAPAEAPAGRAGLVVLSAGLALVGQYLVAEAATTPGMSLWPGLVAYGAAVLAFLLIPNRARPEDIVPDRVAGTASGPRSPWSVRLRRAVAALPVRSACVVLALALSAAVTWMLHTGRPDGQYRDLLGAWIAAVAIYLGAFADLPGLARGDLVDGLRRHRGALVDAGLLLALGLLLRVPLLGSQPDVIGGDEGINGLAARLVAGRWSGSMFETQNAYGTLYYWIHALFLALVPDGVLAVRLPGALAGALAVPFTYLAGRQMFGRWIGLGAGLLLAASHLHLHFSRVAHGQATDSLTAAVVLFTFLRGLQRRDARWMALAGVWLGLAQYGYIGGRAIDLAVALAVLVLALVDRRRVRGLLGLLAVALGGAVVTALPMVRWAIDRPEEYLSRVVQVGFVSQGALAAQTAQTQQPAAVVLAAQLGRAVQAIVAHPAFAFYDSRLAMLDWLWAPLFVLGLAYAVAHLADLRFALLASHVAVVLVMLAGVDNTLDSGYRGTGVLVSAAILAVWALARLVEALPLPAGRPRAIAFGGTVALIALWNFQAYFVDYLPRCGYLDPNSATASYLAEVVRDEAAGDTVIGFTDPDLSAYPSVEFVTGRRVWPLNSPGPLPAEVSRPGEPGAENFIYTALPGMPLDPDWLPPDGPLVLLAGPSRRAELELLAERRPGGKRRELLRCGLPVGVVYTVGAEDGAAP
jgi:4-amino-4-deoxy-L-arabinose transferase-like glycosyltransferase